MHHKASGHAKAKHGKLGGIRIKPTANGGFLVHREHEAPDGGYLSGPAPAPAAFTKSAPAHKHVKDLMAELHGETTSGDMTGEDPEQQQS